MPARARAGIEPKDDFYVALSYVYSRDVMVSQDHAS